MLGRHFGPVSSVYFQALMMKKLRYSKQITTRNDGNVQSHDQEKSQLNSTIITNSCAHTDTHEKIKSSFNKNNVATIKSK